jgi:hypothetical protein
VRIERRLLKVLKELVEYHDITLGNLLEKIVLHASDGKASFSEKTLKKVKDLMSIYKLDLTSKDSHNLEE